MAGRSAHGYRGEMFVEMEQYTRPVGIFDRRLIVTGGRLMVRSIATIACEESEVVALVELRMRYNSPRVEGALDLWASNAPELLRVRLRSFVMSGALLANVRVGSLLLPKGLGVYAEGTDTFGAISLTVDPVKRDDVVAFIEAQRMAERAPPDCHVDR